MRHLTISSLHDGIYILQAHSADGVKGQLAAMTAERDALAIALSRSEDDKIRLTRRHIAEFYELVQENLLLKTSLKTLELSQVPKADALDAATSISPDELAAAVSARDKAEAEVVELIRRRDAEAAQRLSLQAENEALRRELSLERAAVAELILRGEAMTIRDVEMNRRAMAAVSRAGALEFMALSR